LRQNRWRVDDVAHVLRVGLIGGGMPAPQAVDLVTRHIDEWPLIESALVAQAVIMAALAGSQDDPVGKGVAAGVESAGASPASTATAQRSGSRRGKSTK
jgi:Phage tail tube protein, GTA-gp10